MLTAQILNIQRFCTHDGPGIRTTVFLKGCPLRCLWCANPESQNPKTEYAIKTALCKECGTCFANCPDKAVKKSRHTNGRYEIMQDTCSACGTCFASCPNGAVKQFGYTTDLDEIMCEVQKDMPYYHRTGGGLTVSGGEPAMQWKFTGELLLRAKKLEINTLIETAGEAPWEHLWEAVKYADTVYFDLKLASPSLHKKFTGIDNHQILENLRLVSERMPHLVVRIPLIPGINNSEEEAVQIAGIIRSLPSVERIGVLPYHKLGINKYSLLGRKYTLTDTEVPNEAQLNSFRSILEEITGKEIMTGI